jgi:hypothetical protein
MKEFIKKYWKDILLIVFLIVVVLLLKVNNNTKNEVERWQGNYHTAIDSVNVIKAKNDELIYERDNFRLNYEELDKQSQQEIKKLEKELNKQITYISKLEANIKIDTLIIKDSVYVKDNITHINFNYMDEWFKLSGVTSLGKDTTTTINNLNMNVPLTLGLTQKDNKSSIFATTTNPYITFTDINGTELNNTPKEFKHWRWSVGFGFNLQYGILNKTIDNTPYLETGIEYIFKNNINAGAKIGIESQTNQFKTDISPYVGLYVGYGISF